MISSPAVAGPAPSTCVAGIDYTATVDSGYSYVAFKTPDATCVYDIAATQVEYLVVGGGGGGGRVHAGGGGAGGMLTGTASVDVCSSLTVTVGDGGLGNVDAAYPAFRGGANGGNSVLAIVSAGVGSTITAVGGGGGITGGDTALTGGSGGGGLNSSGLGTPGQGNNGSLGQAAVSYGGFVRAYWSGGGGGAGSAGSQGMSSGGDGGAGLAWLPGVFPPAAASALGLQVSSGNVYFAGGGGGGGTSGSFVPTRLEGGLGGIGGGGRGGAGAGASNPDADVAGADGVPGSGGGGGGGGLTDNGGSNPGYSQGGNGGSGIVIVRFVAGEPCEVPGDDSYEIDYRLPVVSGMPETR